MSETASISPAVRETRIVPASSGTLHQTRIEPKLLNPFESVARGELTGLEAFDAELLTREKRAALSLSRPDEKATLWSQYYALKALAVRLDSGCATARERAVFEAGLREYNANFERVRACTSLSVE